MASSYVDTNISDESGKKLPSPSPRALKKMPWSSTSPTHSQDHHHGSHMCVCAPATHPGSFKCRLHRSNSHAPAPQSPPLPPPSTDASLSSKTVEAQ